MASIKVMSVYLILSDDATPQFVVVSEELGSADAILVHSISYPLENAV